LATVLRALGVDDQFISQEVGAMTEFVTAKTSNRSVPVTMNVFSFLAKTYRDMMETSDLLALALRLADTPCSPIKYNSPARVMQDLVAGGFA
jgi:hypothetical protein